MEFLIRKPGVKPIPPQALEVLTRNVWNAVKPFTGPNTPNEKLVFVGVVLAYGDLDENGAFDTISLMLPSYQVQGILASQVYAAASNEARMKEDNIADEPHADDGHQGNQV